MIKFCRLCAFKVENFVVNIMTIIAFFDACVLCIVSREGSFAILQRVYNSF